MLSPLYCTFPRSASGQPPCQWYPDRLWEKFFCYDRYQSVQQYSCKDFAGNGEQGDHRVVGVVILPSPLFLYSVMMPVLQRSGWSFLPAADEELVEFSVQCWASILLYLWWNAIISCSFPTLQLFYGTPQSPAMSVFTGCCVMQIVTDFWTVRFVEVLRPAVKDESLPVSSSFPSALCRGCGSSRRNPQNFTESPVVNSVGTKWSSHCGVSPPLILDILKLAPKGVVCKVEVCLFLLAEWFRLPLPHQRDCSSPCFLLLWRTWGFVQRFAEW